MGGRKIHTGLGALPPSPPSALLLFWAATVSAGAGAMYIGVRARVGERWATGDGRRVTAWGWVVLCRGYATTIGLCVGER